VLILKKNNYYNVSVIKVMVKKTKSVTSKMLRFNKKIYRNVTIIHLI